LIKKTPEQGLIKISGVDLKGESARKNTADPFKQRTKRQSTTKRKGKPKGLTERRVNSLLTKRNYNVLRTIRK